MKFKTIPQTQLTPSALCLGAAMLGSEIDEAASFALLDRFVEAGGNFIDTARIYADWLGIGQGLSEKTIGRWLKVRGHRDQIILATKGGHPDLAQMNRPRLAPDQVAHDLEASLAALQTDVIDLYWLHRDDPARAVDEIIETLNALVRSGKIRHFGCSNWTPARIEQARQYAAAHGLACFVANQNMWSLAQPNLDVIEDKTMIVMDEAAVQLHRETQMAAIPYSPQAGGFFIKQVIARIGAQPLSPALATRYANPTNTARLERLEKLAATHGANVGQLALAWLINQPFVTVPIVGCRTHAQLDDSLAAAQLRLTPEELAFLETGA